MANEVVSELKKGASSFKLVGKMVITPNTFKMESKSGTGYISNKMYVGVNCGIMDQFAIAMGKKNPERAENIMANCFTMLLIFAVVLTPVFYALAPTLLRLFGASDATLPYAVSYGRIYILGSVFITY